MPIRKTIVTERSETSKDIDRAVSRIYQIYGPDLSAFMSSLKQKREIESPPRKKIRRK
jgi:hypothetical protein